MVKLPGSVYLKKTNKETDILTFGKSPEISEKDFKEGISRFGGFMRQPSYSQAYLKSAKIVLDKATDSGEFDELGLPIFYLVRHALELKIKGLLEMAYDVLEMTLECYPNRGANEILPSKGQRDRLKKSHDLGGLFEDLKKSCAALGVRIPEDSFLEVIGLISDHEINPTWSRYSKSHDGAHVDEEVLLPIVQLVKNLEILFEVVSYEQLEGTDSLESELYFMFSSLTSTIEREKC
jgi:hypothetical protein